MTGVVHKLSCGGVQAKVWPTVAAGWKLWIPAHVVNFGFVPPSQRVLYVNVVAVSHRWSCSAIDILSSMFTLAGTGHLDLHLHNLHMQMHVLCAWKAAWTDMRLRMAADCLDVHSLPGSCWWW
jgi:hypothetical protein